MECVANAPSHILHSEESSSDENDENSPPQEAPRRFFVYEFERSFPNIADAKLYVRDQHTWNLCYTRDNCEGRKFVYTCMHQSKCAARIYLLKPFDQDIVKLFSTGLEHDHEEVSKIGLPHTTKARLKELFTIGVTKPRAFLHALKKEGIEPKISQIGSYVQYNIRNKLGPRVVSLGEMQSVCDQNSISPDLMDSPYVVDYNVNFETKSFKIVLSTKRLLSLMFKSEAVQADGTYKLMWEGFPVLMMGTSDKARRFHPFCIAVTSNETHQDYAFCFRALEKFSEGKYNPKILIADCAESITNGFKEVFGDPIKRVHCWAHVLRNLSDSKLLHSLSKTDQHELVGNIKLIQHSRAEKEFDAAAILFIKKWNEQVPDFVKYFTSEYVNTNKGWFEGAATGFPSTNNGLEATNRVLKSEGTFHERVSFGVLLETLKKVLQTWSEERNPETVNFKIFADKPNDDLKIQTAAFNWARDKSTEIKYRTSPNQQAKYFFIPSKGSPALKDRDIEQYIRLNSRCSWKTFEGYKKCISRLDKVEMNEDWEKSKCTCISFQKEYVCHHILGIAIKKNLYNVRPEAKIIPIGQKRKRGRPAKAKKALIIQ